MVVERYSRPILVTASGTAINRATRLAYLSVKPTLDDVIVRLKNAKTGAEVWRVEADNGSGSHFENYNPPMMFPDGILVTIEGAGHDDAVCLGVIEPL